MKRQFIKSPIEYQDTFSYGEIRDFAKAHPTDFLGTMDAAAQKGELRLQDIADIKGLYQSLCDIQVPLRIEMAGAQRSIMASAFPVLTGSLVIAAMNAQYQSIETVGERLVEDIEDNKKVTSIAAVHNLDKDIEEVKEGEDFPEISATEEKAEIRHKRNGRTLRITAEMIEENEMADIVSMVNAIPQISSDWIEEQTLKRVTDHYGSKSSASEPYVYRPDGTGTTLYSATANTPGTRAPLGTRITNNALVDETDLDAARTRLASMKNNRGKRIAIPRSMLQIVVPDALLGTLAKILNSEYVPGVENELSNWGPRGLFHIPIERVVSSPKLDDLSTSAWYYGAFPQQFKRKWKLRFEYVTLGMDTQAYLNSRIAFQARIAWDCEIGATDYIYCLQCLATTTAPADE
ncbi:MAG TPA: hypothetical protein PKM59_03805 [Thermodesulfobacteriota bacterium]|nr:hypothetical protein [Thermodesulfobacteriota bacterium]